jgi:flap endonuclease-1
MEYNGLHWIAFFIQKIDFAMCLASPIITQRKMGIKNLNQFIRHECLNAGTANAVKTIHLNELSGKTVVVDASIFMYRFIADDALLENMYSMMSFFQMHNIVALFIFDGKPPEEKRKTINKRKRLKCIAEMHYNRLVRNINLNADHEDGAAGSGWLKKEKEHALKVLRRRFIRVSDDDFDRVKTLMRALGVQYMVADGEADVLCAQMVIKRKAYACVSDDTDLFVYGCTRVLRHINLFDQTATLYDMPKILTVLGTSMTEFRQICVISGTDYHAGPMHGLNLKVALDLFKHYKKCALDAETNDDVFAPDFYTWMHHHCTKYNKHIRFDYDATMTVYNMFNPAIVNLPTIAPVNAVKNRDLLREVMAHENFIFVY